MMTSTEKEVRTKMFELAVKKGYCDIYSSHEVIEAALRQIAHEIFNLKRDKK